MKKLLKNKKVAIPILILIFLAVIGIGGFAYYNQSLRPISEENEQVIFEVKQGDSIASLSDRLQEQGIIRNAFTTKVYAKLHGLHEIKAGSFQLDKSWSSNKILAALTDAKLAKGNEISITFPEGIWAKDIAAKLEKELGVSAKELIDLWNDTDYIKDLMKTYDFLDKDVLKEGTRVKLEGYLFPETYSFAKDADTDKITRMFLDHFQVIYDLYKDAIKKSGQSLHDVLTLASIVQFESSKEEDMKMIAGVFQNRLKSDMPLGSSVTICYAMYEDFKNAEQCETNTDIDSPYNTYLHKGLPIGPIENPGEAAIRAVLQPKKSDYLYFVANIYGDGQVYYAKTLEEQEANIDKYHLRK